VYHEATEVSATVTDALSGVYAVDLYYRTSIDWIKIPATVDGSEYSATIPMLPYGTNVEYYLNATDWTGHFIVDTTDSFTVGDDVNPTISLSGVDEGDTIAGTLLLTATATDAASGVDYVEFQVDGTMVNQDSSTPYQYVLNLWPYSNGSHTISAVAYDNEGNHLAETFNVNVQNDVTGPIISEVVVNPSIPTYDHTTTIYVGVSDTTGISNVTIYYRVDGDGFYHDTMQNLGGSLYSFWTDLDYGVLYEYYIVAYDTTPNTYSTMVGSESTPMSFVVGDTIAPLLGVSGPPNSASVRDTVQFALNAEDAGSGIDEVRLMVDGVMVSSTSGDSISWNTLDYTNGNHTLTFVALDNAGNTAEFSIEYQVENPEGFGSIVESLSNIMASYGFFVGAGTMVIVLVAGKVLMNKRSAAGAASKPKGRGKKK